jgi:hypothetical protein
MGYRLADIINSGRVKSLNLEELSPRTASGLMERLQVPHTYCWSLALIPKPSDWPPYIGNLLSLNLNHGIFI